MIIAAFLPQDKDWIDLLTALATIAAAAGALLAARYAYCAFMAQRGQVEILGEQLTMDKERAEARIRLTSPKFELPFIDGAVSIKGTSGTLLSDYILSKVNIGLGPGFDALVGHGDPDDPAKGFLVFANTRPGTKPRSITAKILDGPPGLKTRDDLFEILKLQQREDDLDLWALEIKARARDFNEHAPTLIELEFINCDGMLIAQRYRYKLGGNELVYVEK